MLVNGFIQRKKYCRRSGLFITEISKEALPEAKIFPFFKLTNFFGKGKIFCDYFAKTLKEFLQPRFFGNTMLYAVF